MSNLKETLRIIDRDMNRVQPKSIDDAIKVVKNCLGAWSYEIHFCPVEYMGVRQGIRIKIVSRKNEYTIPKGGKVYSIFQ